MWQARTWQRRKDPRLATWTLRRRRRLQAAQPLVPREPDRRHTVPSTEALGYVWILNGAAHGADVPIDVREGERVEITGTGEKPKLSGIVQLVADAQKSKSRAQHLANRAARLLTVVVIACPHPFGLAVPLVWSDPRDIPRIITLSSATYRKMVQNLCWAARYNIFAIPLATGALAPWGILCIPTVGAVLMSASTVAVAINAQLLKRVRR